MIATAFIAATSLLAAPSEPWTIKSPIAKDVKLVYKVTADANINGSSHQAQFMQHVIWTGADKDLCRVELKWTDLEVDASPVGEAPSWFGRVNADGVIANVDDDDTIRRMSSPFMFVYPKTAIAKGSKWSLNFDPGEKIPEKQTYDFEVTGSETLSGIETLTVKSTLKEKGDAGMAADCKWWVAKDGKVRKFEAKIKNWVVPMAGGDPFEATVNGTLL